MTQKLIIYKNVVFIYFCSHTILYFTPNIHTHRLLYRSDKMMHNKSFNTVFIITAVVCVALAAPHHKDESDLKQVSITSFEDDAFSRKIP